VKDLKDFTRSIAQVLDFKEQVIPEWFNIEEAKDGYFIAVLQKGKWLGDLQFKALCALMRDLKGDYIRGAKTFRVPGPYAKKEVAKPQGHGMHSQPTYKEPGNEVPAEPCGVAPPLISQDKSRPPQLAVPIGALLSLPYQCRENPEDPDLAELVESIKNLGMLQPILVRPKPDGLYEIVAGQRRVRAAKKAGLVEVPVNIRILSDEEAYGACFAENIQRRDLSDMEKARMLDYLTKQFGYTQEQMAQKLGKERGWVARHLAMLNLENVSPGIQTGTLTERQAREILAAPPEKQEEILNKINETGQVPSAREIHAEVHTVSCAWCGDPVAEPVHIDGKFYCVDCAELVQAEKKPGLVPETKHDFAGDETGAAKPSASSGSVNIGEFECPECHKHFIVEHLSNGKHKLQPVREEAGSYV